MHDVTTCHPPSGRCRPHPLARLARLAAIGLGLVVLPTRPSSAAEAAGITEPFLDVTLSSPVPGIVSRQRFKEGEFVQEGQPIMELDKRLEELEETRRKLVADLRRADFEATQTLFQNSKAVSKEEVDKKLVEFKVAAVEHELAVEQLRRRLLIAPLSGTVTEYLLDVGEACEPYRPLVRVVDTRR
ncbi:MAG TPA: biotin/lipoyl-binding protein, partial [Methylomirabilota bacterium]|nr:biotin/lipoyl-binding protein [Methylomirabilota bacterium]